MTLALVVALILALLIAAGALWYARVQSERLQDAWIELERGNQNLCDALLDAERRARRRARRTDGAEVPQS